MPGDDALVVVEDLVLFFRKDRFEQRWLREHDVHLARAAAPIADNYVLSDEKLAVEELNAFKALGGRTVVEVTSIGIKRDPLALRRVSERTGLNIVMGTGFYQRVYHPDDMDRRTLDDLTATIVREVARVTGNVLRHFAE